MCVYSYRPYTFRISTILDARLCQATNTNLKITFIYIHSRVTWQIYNTLRFNTLSLITCIHVFLFLSFLPVRSDALLQSKSVFPLTRPLQLVFSPTWTVYVYARWFISLSDNAVSITNSTYRKAINEIPLLQDIYIRTLYNPFWQRTIYFIPQLCIFHINPSLLRV